MALLAEMASMEAPASKAMVSEMEDGGRDGINGGCRQSWHRWRLPAEMVAEVLEASKAMVVAMTKMAAMASWTATWVAIGGGQLLMWRWHRQHLCDRRWRWGHRYRLWRRR